MSASDIESWHSPGPQIDIHMHRGFLAKGRAGASRSGHRGSSEGGDHVQVCRGSPSWCLVLAAPLVPIGAFLGGPGCPVATTGAPRCARAMGWIERERLPHPSLPPGKNRGARQNRVANPKTLPGRPQRDSPMRFFASVGVRTAPRTKNAPARPAESRPLVLTARWRQWRGKMKEADDAD